MAGFSIKHEQVSTLLTRKKNYKEKGKNDSRMNRDDINSSNKGNTKTFKCYQCVKLGYKRRNYHVRLKESNVAKTLKHDSSQNEENLEKCFIAKTTNVVAMASINFDNDWIVDFGCSHHLIGVDSKFSSFCHYEGKDAIVTADITIHSIEKEDTIIINVKEDDYHT